MINFRTYFEPITSVTTHQKYCWFVAFSQLTLCSKFGLVVSLSLSLSLWTFYKLSPQQRKMGNP